MAPAALRRTALRPRRADRLLPATPVAVVILLAAAAGCVNPPSSGPGLDNPQLVAYRTSDLVPQLVVKGAFKDREYDHIEMTVNGATLAGENNTYLVSEKLNVSSFNLTVIVLLERDVYRWDAAIAVLPDGLRVTEIEKGVAGKPETRGYPFTKILEKLPEVQA